jgi:hypothetical protein
VHSYRWNSTVNINGGVHNNIPDDNLVELNVKILKGLVQAQGPYRLKPLETPYIHDVNINMCNMCSVATHGDRIKAADKTCDIDLMTKEILSVQMKLTDVRIQFFPHVQVVTLFRHGLMNKQ